jgi:C_GCAxxG_C_C family probable redox protein
MIATVPEADAAVANFLQGFTCAQAVLGAFAERYRVSKEHAVRISCAFGGGMVPTGQVCGALSGALMVLGLAHGGTADNKAAQEKTRMVTQELWKRFQARHGSVTCRELLGVDIGTPEGLRAAVRKGLFRSVCPGVVHDAAAVAAQFI